MDVKREQAPLGANDIQAIEPLGLRRRPFCASTLSSGMPTQIGHEYIERVRVSPAARRVRASSHNTTIRFASKKMGRVVECESTIELAFALECEYSSAISEFFSQPRRPPALSSGVVQSPGFTVTALLASCFA